MIIKLGTELCIYNTGKEQAIMQQYLIKEIYLDQMYGSK